MFGGTTNNKDVLHDPTGNRRFWPVDTLVCEPTLSIWEDMTPEVIGQIWAEAMYLYNKGESVFLPKDLEEVAREVQEEHSERDEREGMIRKYLDTLLPDNWDKMDTYQRREYLQGDEELNPRGSIERKHVTTMEIWTECYGKPESDLDQYKGKEIRKIIAAIGGWDYRAIKHHGISQRGYARKV